MDFSGVVRRLLFVVLLTKELYVPSFVSMADFPGGVVMVIVFSDVVTTINLTPWDTLFITRPRQNLSLNRDGDCWALDFVKPLNQAGIRPQE